MNKIKITISADDSSTETTGTIDVLGMAWQTVCMALVDRDLTSKTWKRVFKNTEVAVVVARSTHDETYIFRTKDLEPSPSLIKEVVDKAAHTWSTTITTFLEEGQVVVYSDYERMQLKAMLTDLAVSYHWSAIPQVPDTYLFTRQS
jgi:hypothetical protein